MLVGVAMFSIIKSLTTRVAKVGPERRIINPGGPEAARIIVVDFLHGSDERFRDLFRLDKRQFNILNQWVVVNTSQRDNRNTTVAQRLLVFLWIAAYGEPQRNAAHLFRISRSTVSQIINELLPIFVLLHMAYVRPPVEGELSDEIEQHHQLREAFAGCIGAVDGSHIHAHIPLEQQKRWRNRKAVITQNILAAVRFDGSFAYILAGCEGAVHDARLLTWAFNRGFHIPKNRYYLGDAGFGNRAGIVIPFPRTRYHLQEWGPGNDAPNTPEELFNLRHTVKRVVVEQAFGSLKRQWKIVRSSPAEYRIDKQRSFVYAVTGLHNFIRYHTTNPQDPVELPANWQEAAAARARLLCEDRGPEEIREAAATLMWQRWIRR